LTFGPFNATMKGMGNEKMQLTPIELTAAIKDQALALGFDHCRIAPVANALHADFFDAWVALDRPGEMGYLARNQAKRRNPALLAEEDAGPFRSVIVLAVDYHQFDLPQALRDDPSRGVIASYAWGDDYHEIIRPLLHELDAFIRARSGRASLGKCLVDTGPVLERDWALQAGIGFTGKNCCTIHPAQGAGGGSWLILATIMVPERLAYDPAPEPRDVPDLAVKDILRGVEPARHLGFWRIPVAEKGDAEGRRGGNGGEGRAVATCGQCTRCLSACPTGAFIGPYHLDPQRCISYWTIESRRPIPRELRPLFGNRIFGCDICQEVCPWNQRLDARAPRLAGLRAQADRVAPPLLEGFDPATPYWLDQAAFSARFRRSPIKRAKRRGMLRNVCVALGNWADPQVVDALDLALRDPDPLPRGHAAWALGRVLSTRGDPRARAALEEAAHGEEDSWVLEEIRLALG
jgi:epoxyqueuosine reductase